MIQEIMERREIEGIWEAFYLLSIDTCKNKNKGHHHWQNKKQKYS